MTTSKLISQPTALPRTKRREQAPDGFTPHPARGRFNAAFFGAMGGYINWLMKKRKAKAFAGLPVDVVEIGSGVGANCGICHKELA